MKTELETFEALEVSMLLPYRKLRVGPGGRDRREQAIVKNNY
jgi:hypothetical protein